MVNVGLAPVIGRWVSGPDRLARDIHRLATAHCGFALVHDESPGDRCGSDEGKCDVAECKRESVECDGESVAYQRAPVACKRESVESECDSAKNGRASAEYERGSVPEKCESAKNRCGSAEDERLLDTVIVLVASSISGLAASIFKASAGLRRPGQRRFCFAAATSS